MKGHSTEAGRAVGAAGAAPRVRRRRRARREQGDRVMLEPGRERSQGSWRGQIESWCDLWSIPELASRVYVTTSPRFRSTLGRFCFSRNEVRLAEHLVRSAGSLLLEVLCHEFAHAAVAARHGRVRPHGPEWQRLMKSAGFEPRVRIPPAEVQAAGIPFVRSRARWVHCCPVCQASRLAARPFRNWRCAACYSQGLSGVLEITRLPAGGRPV